MHIIHLASKRRESDEDDLHFSFAWKVVVDKRIDRFHFPFAKETFAKAFDEQIYLFHDLRL